MRLLRIGAAGMRGEVGAGLNPMLAIEFASAMGTRSEGGRVVVARDTRASSDMLFHACASGLLACGCELVDAGICPAPALHHMIPALGADGGLLVGAAHHQAGWNAVAPLASNGAYMDGAQLQELLDIYHGRVYKNRDWRGVGKVVPAPEGSLSGYLDMLCSKIDTAAIRARRMRVVADFCNGSGSALADEFASRLGLEMIAINNVFSGVLPHDPEPRPRSSVQAQSIMGPLKADAGFVFNSDMSRMAVVASSCETLSEEYTFPLFAARLLPGGGLSKSVVTNWCTTRTLDDIVARCGGSVVKTKVGQAPIIDKMLDSGALLGGDGSGSVALNGAVNGFDGYLAMGVILEAMAVGGKTSADLAEELPRYHIIKRKVNCPSAHAYTLIRAMKNLFPGARVNEEDGLRFDWADGWLHLRASSTEPLIRMIVEWRDKAGAEETAATVRNHIERLVAS